MKFIGYIREEGGYTLIETLVAMGLFVGVLIPLGASIGNMVIEDSSARMSTAYHLALSEMNRVDTEGKFCDADSVQDGCLIRRRVCRQGNIVELNVAVYHSSKPDRRLVFLTRTFLDYR